MFVLTNLQKLIIIAGCVGLIVIVVFLTLCIVCPACCIYKRVEKRRKRQENELKFLRNSFPLSYLNKDPPPPYELTSGKTFIDINAIQDFNRRSVNSVSSVCSDTDSVTGIPIPVLSDSEVGVEIKENAIFVRGYVKISLLYKRITGEDRKVFPQLRVDLKEAGDLTYRLYGGRCNPYVVIGLYDLKTFNRRRRRKSIPTPLHQFFSTVIKKSLQPVYNESFFFPMDGVNIKKCTLKVEVWDQDKLANDTILGEITFNLKDVSAYLCQEPFKELDLNLKLEEPKVNNGQLLLGLCYLPTSERMTIAVLKANNLKKQIERSEDTSYYVQAMAIHGGKIYERRKTSSRSSSQFPVFNEMLMFDVPFAKIDHVVLLLAVYKVGPQTTSDDGEVQIKQKSKDNCIGKIVIGSTTRKSTLNHWNAMKNAPRRQVIQWHELK